MIRLAFLILISAAAVQGCTCIAFPDAKGATDSAAVVFRGTVLKKEMLPQHPEMRDRARYVVTFRVQAYWKGNAGKVVRLYNVAAGADCLGSSYNLGKEYLVYASNRIAQDYRLGDYFWYGWTDAVPKGESILEPVTGGCMPGGEIGQASANVSLQELGRGRRP